MSIVFTCDACVDRWLYVKRCLKSVQKRTHSHGGGHMRQLYLTLPGLLISALSSVSECVFSALPQDIFVHVKHDLICHVLDLLYLSLNKNKKMYPLNIVAVFFSVVSKMVSNIDIFQGIVSKLKIPVSWQHYSARTLQFCRRKLQPLSFHIKARKKRCACNVVVTKVMKAIKDALKLCMHVLYVIHESHLRTCLLKGFQNCPGAPQHCLLI